MTARTPGPWYASGVDIMVAHADSVRNAVANTTCAGSMTREEDEANAAFIVEACNAHARLARERKGRNIVLASDYAMMKLAFEDQVSRLARERDEAIKALKYTANALAEHLSQGVPYTALRGVTYTAEQMQALRKRMNELHDKADAASLELARLARERDEATARCARLEEALRDALDVLTLVDMGQPNIANVPRGIESARAALKGE